MTSKQACATSKNASHAHRSGSGVRISGPVPVNGPCSLYQKRQERHFHRGNGAKQFTPSVLVSVVCPATSVAGQCHVVVLAVAEGHDHAVGGVTIPASGVGGNRVSAAKVAVLAALVSCEVTASPASPAPPMSIHTVEWGTRTQATPLVEMNALYALPRRTAHRKARAPGETWGPAWRAAAPDAER